MYSKADIDSMAGDTVFGPLPIILSEKKFKEDVPDKFKGLFLKFKQGGFGGEHIIYIKIPSAKELEQDRTRILELPSTRQVSPRDYEMIPDDLKGLFVKRGPFYYKATSEPPAHAARNAPIDPINKKLYDTLNKKMPGFLIVVKPAPGKKDTIQIEINEGGYGTHGPYFHYDIKNHELVKRAKDLQPQHQTALEESLEEVFGKHNGGRRRTHRKRKNKRKSRR
jgi:hypothetical protein